mmetsp:Transcript_3971/g.10202  ORF Transcript_3971/g.10202 Transcript_3971/m.10202 type:complete len:461 (+) Transcript_3971:25-1407(+)
MTSLPAGAGSPTSPCQALPSAAIDKVRAIPGNEVCMDCGSSEPDWGDVLTGSLHCIQCAGIHRGLGVSVSFCRSLTMDNWTERHLLAMLLGGNRQLRSFFERQEIENTATEVLYRTKQASCYRDQLAAQVEQTLEKRREARKERRGEAHRRVPASPPSPPERFVVNDFDVDVRTSSLGASLSRALPPPGVARTSSGGNGSWPLVTKLADAGVARAQGVEIGDFVVAMNGRAVVDYDEFVSLFPRCPRPLRLTVRRFRTEKDVPERPAPERAPEPDSGDAYDAVFEDGPMGFSIERDDTVARVSKVAPGGKAAARGVRVSDVVFKINGRDAPAYDDVVALLPRLPRPLTLTFKRAKQTLPPAEVLQVSLKHAALGDFEDEKEFDVRLETGPLGLRIEERSGLVPITVVTHCDADGQAYRAGVRVGSVVVGLNGQKALSHAHTTATLKHAKRPVHVRFRLSD